MNAKLNIGDLMIVLGESCVYSHFGRSKLTPKRFKLLVELARHKNEELPYDYFTLRGIAVATTVGAARSEVWQINSVLKLIGAGCKIVDTGTGFTIVVSEPCGDVKEEADRLIHKIHVEENLKEVRFGKS